MYASSEGSGQSVKSTDSPVLSFLGDAIITSRAISYLSGSYDFYYNHSSCFILTSQHLLTIMKTMDPSCIKKENKSGGPTETKWHKNNIQSNCTLMFNIDQQ